MEEVNPKITLFNTRLREFEEKNNLVFQHYLSAKNSLRRNSETPSFGDQFRRGSVQQEDLIDADEQVFQAMQNIFRRTSIADPKRNKLEVLETRMIPIIFARLGVEYDTEELRRWIKANDRHGLGVVDFNGYQRICVHFVKDPEAIQRAKTAEFSFSNLIRKDSDLSDSNSDLSSSE